MTVDGFCDHTAVNPDEQIHNHYTELLNNAGTILYGRITYQLMEFWKPFVEKPSGIKSMDDFAISIDKIQKIVFSNTLKSVNWKTATLSKQTLKETVFSLRHQSGKDIFVGSPSLIVQLTNLNLINEYQLCVHPVITGSGLPLFKNTTNKTALKLVKTKTFNSGAIILYYKPIIKQ